MRSDWFKGCKDDAAKDERRELVKTATPTLNVLRNILQDKLEEAQATQVGEGLYSSPSWPYVQADKNAQIRVYKDLIKLVEVSDKEEKK